MLKIPGKFIMLKNCNNPQDLLILYFYTDQT